MLTTALALGVMCAMQLPACDGDTATSEATGAGGDTTASDPAGEADGSAAPQDASALGDDATTPSGDAADLTTGIVVLRFSVSKTVRKSPNLVDTLQGTIYGSLWHRTDVALTGPRNGTEDLQSVEVANVDLIDQELSEASWQSEPLEPGEYMFLGFFDVDGNGAGEHDPDSGDPVTLPINSFVIEAGKTIQVDAPFELVYN